jgi:hypothetical protein
LNRFDTSKFLFYLVSIVGALGLSFGFGLHSGAKKTIVYQVVSSLNTSIRKNVIQGLGEFSTLTKAHPKHFLQPVRYDGAGIIVNDVSGVEEELIFLSGFFDNNNEVKEVTEARVYPSGYFRVSDWWCK